MLLYSRRRYLLESLGLVAWNMAAHAYDARQHGRDSPRAIWNKHTIAVLRVSMVQKDIVVSLLPWSSHIMRSYTLKGSSSGPANLAPGTTPCKC